ncbi:MAG TPA: type II toxin-antitoxin system VapC family toxin [Candidatus Woesebacteria bacterium]|nr:type II toxin-antitoxin system VapC family toxin [Candidatus Woesebacteria bacterium]
MADKKLRYWDSDTFLAYLEGDKTKAPYCMGVIQSIENDEIEIVTSALTITEVLYLKGHPKVTTEISDKIADFFQSNFIKIINLDRKTAEIGRDLVLNQNVRPKDAVHLATASQVNNNIRPIECFDTFDKDLIRLSNKIGNPTFKIAVPDVPFQEKLV